MPHEISNDHELAGILAAIEIVSPSLLMFAGKPVPLADTSQRSPLQATLQNTLYNHCYCRRFGSETVQQMPQQVQPDPAFIARLSQANASSSRWDAGWQVRRLEKNGGLWAEKVGLTRMFAPGEFMNFHAPGLPMKKGDLVSVYVVRESTTVQPGLYYAFGETVMTGDQLDLVRFYWNLENAGAPLLMQRVTRDLNRFQVPFQFKCSIYAHAFDRRDGAVLYVHKRYFRLVNELANGWAQECASSLRDDIPLFTLAIGKGVGVAEDPGTGESFGMNRCRHVAESLCNSHSKGVAKEHYLRELKHHLQEHGFNPDRLYLSPGSPDQYRAAA